MKRASCPAAEPRAKAPSAPAAAQSDEPKAQDLEKITVTGTRIRGGSTTSPVITIDAEDIREEGFTDLGEVIRSPPQNFDGGQNPGPVKPPSSLGRGANGNTQGGAGRK